MNTAAYGHPNYSSAIGMYSVKLHLRHKRTKTHVRLFVCLSVVCVRNVHRIRGTKRQAKRRGIKIRDQPINTRGQLIIRKIIENYCHHLSHFKDKTQRIRFLVSCPFVSLSGQYDNYNLK